MEYLIKIKGDNNNKVIEITHWLYNNHKYDWPRDYDWRVDRNNDTITFNCKEADVGVLILLRFGE
jgi:hypothetical protein